ncbi:MAG: hypothetical protein H6699_10465 [Myxococcales bacterium]|nr:hypothetical protein [Myxococcales bacterium]
MNRNPVPARLLVGSLAVVAVACVGTSRGCGSSAGAARPAPALQATGVPSPTEQTPHRAAFAGGPWEWESRGIGGGGTFIAAAINPHDPSDIAISTDMGMAFRSVDFGRSWFALHFETLRGTDRAVLEWTSDPNVLYTIDWRGYDGSFIVRSEDGGRSWERLPVDPTHGEAWWVDVDTTRTDRLLLAGWDSLWLSRDAGATWKQVAAAAEQTAGLYVAGAVWADENVVIGTADTLLVSNDGGETFAAHPYDGLPAGAVVGSLAGAFDGHALRVWLVSRAEGTVWPGIRPDQWAGYRGVWTSDLGVDDRFRSLTDSLPQTFAAVNVGAARDNLDVVYLSGADTDLSMPAILRSLDGGRSWTSTFRTIDNENIHSGWCGARGDLDYWWSSTPSTFAVSPADPAALVFGDYGFVHVSGDGGTTWRQAYVDVADQNAPGAPTQKGRAYAGIGLEDTSAWWLHWTAADTVFAGFSDIRGIRSTDGGHKWVAGIALGLPNNSTYHIVEHPVTGALYAATASIHDLYQSTYLTDELILPGEGSILVSQDGGASWSVLRNMGKSVVWVALDPNDPNTLYASVAGYGVGGIYVTHNLDAGTESAWRRVGSPPRTEGHPYTVEVLRDGTLVSTWSGRRTGDGAFTASSGVFVSHDGGESWEDHSHPDMRLWTKDLVIDPHDETQSTWYVGVFSHWGAAPNEIGGLFRTRDRGQTWQRLNSLYRVESVAVDPENADLMFVTTETQGLWVSQDASSDAPTFSQVLTYPFEHPTRVFFNPYNPAEVWATSFGGGLRVWNRSDGSGGFRAPSAALIFDRDDSSDGSGSVTAEGSAQTAPAAPPL